MAKKKELSQRIAILWMAITGADHPRGSMAWYARLAKVRPRTVRNWCNGHHNPELSPEGRAALEWLDEAEAGVGPEQMKEAGVRYRRYKRTGAKRFRKGQ